jgi:predicted glycosyltransferase involved in capsule biosynthesis
MKNTTVIIHFRADCVDRIFNLKVLLGYLSSHNIGEIILINDDKVIDPIIRWVNKKYPNIVTLFLKNDDDFKKSLAFNIAAQLSKFDVFCFCDVDVLIPIEQLIESENLILSNVVDHVFPFCGIFINVKKCFFESFLPTYNFRILYEQVEDSNLGYNNDNICVKSDNSPGGCNLISKDAFYKIGGYDIDFIGWGFEDTDFKERSKLMNRVQYLDGEKYLFHLDHSTHTDDVFRSAHVHYMNNYNKFLTNRR